MGYYSGVKEGLEYLSKQRNETQDNEYRKAQTQKAEFELQQEQQAATDQNRAKAILQKAMDASAFEQTGKDVQETNSTISNTLMTAGKQILAIDPKSGLELIKQGTSASNAAALSGYHTAEAKKYQLGVANDLYAQVAPDGSDWADVQDQLAEVGVVVPDQFKSWGSETEQWINRRAIQSQAAIKVLGAQQKVVANDIKQQDANTKRITADTKASAEKAKEAKAQASYKPLSGKPLEAALIELNTDEKFDGLDAGVKMQVTQDYNNQVQQNITAGMPAEIARATARANIMGRIKENTFGSNEYKGAESATPGGPKVGSVVKGWTFVGGDPSKKESWKK